MISIISCTRDLTSDNLLEVTVVYTVDSGPEITAHQKFHQIPKYNYIICVRPSRNDIILVDLNDQMLYNDSIAEVVLQI
jgi:hypothetical protein